MAQGFEIDNIGLNKYALVALNADMHMGESIEFNSYYAIEKKYPNIFSSIVYHDNNGDCNFDGEMEELPPCYENNTEIHFLQGEDPVYFDIKTHTTGTTWDYDNKKIIDLDEYTTYQFQNGKYIEKK